MRKMKRLPELAEELGCTVERAGVYTGVEEGYLTSEPIDGWRITTPGWYEGHRMPLVRNGECSKTRRGKKPALPR